MSAAARIARKTAVRWETLLIVLVLACGVWSWTLSPYFLGRSNLLDLLTPYVYIDLLAFGLMFVMVIGEIDISVCSTMAASAAVFARLANGGVNVWLSAVVALAVAALFGLGNGLLIGVLGLPSLAVTLGTLATYRGLAYVILRTHVGTGFPSSFEQIGGGYIANELPIALLVLIGAAIILGLLLQTTRFGRCLYAIGSSREVSRYSGIAVRRIRVSVFVLSGLMAGVAGIVYLGFFGSVQADAASGSELIDVITVVVLGGVSIYGGFGTVVGVFIACVLVGELRNGMQLANVNTALQGIVVGALLIAAIVAGNVIRMTELRVSLKRGFRRVREGVIGAPKRAR
jgi:rhamnose transport system permease protein